MVALLCGAIWFGLVLYLLSRALRQFAARANSTLSTIAEPPQPAVVSIIVPVRNEIDNIVTCLSGLTSQSGLAPGSSITIVDDASEDGTAATIEQQIRQGRPIRLLTAGTLPEGWIGKPHACWVGALATTGAWLCFVDADVRVDPRLIGAAVDAAEAQAIDMLSLHPFQQLGSFWERLVMPAGLLVIACAKPLVSIEAPLASPADANGQVILIRRDVYFQVGGHAAVAGEICEDKAMASRVAQSGFCFRVMAADQLASTRMYHGLRSLWGGLAKNAGEMLGTGSRTLCVSMAGMLIGWGVLLAPVLLAAAILPSTSVVEVIGLTLMIAGSGVVLGVQLMTARHFQMSIAYGLLMPLGYTVAALLVCNSLLLRLRGRVAWKGRTYDLRRKRTQASF